MKTKALLFLLAEGVFWTAVLYTFIEGFAIIARY